MEEELFELCHDVHRRTSWEGLPNAYYKEGPYTVFDGNIEYPEGELYLAADTGKYDLSFPTEYICPLYTSDYLLEKLPKELHKDEKIHYLSLIAKYGDEFKANYISPTGYLYLFLEPESDTPLKALLKLTIALHEAGELK